MPQNYTTGQTSWKMREALQKMLMETLYKLNDGNHYILLYIKYMNYTHGQELCHITGNMVNCQTVHLACSEH